LNRQLGRGEPRLSSKQYIAKIRVLSLYLALWLLPKPLSPSSLLERALVENCAVFILTILSAIESYSTDRHFKLSKEETARGENKEQLEAAIISRVGIQGHEKDN